MKNGNWVAIDKAVRFHFPTDRPYSICEALLSFTIDQDFDREWSINGYASLWGWSRGKVRRFIEGIRTTRGHVADRKRTGNGHAIRFISKDLQDKKDNSRTTRGQLADNSQDTTNKTKTKTNIILLRPDFISEKDWVDLIEHRKKKKAANTERALVSLSKEIKKATENGFSAEECINEITNRNWMGFKAEWMKKGDNGDGRNTESPHRELDEKAKAHIEFLKRNSAARTA